MCSTDKLRDWFDDFEFDLGPIFNWLSIIGINLKQNQPKKRKFLQLLCGTGLLLNSIFIVFMAYIEYGKMNFFEDSVTVRMVEKRATRIASTVFLLGVVLYCSKGLRADIFLFFQTKTRWLDLWRSLQKLHRFTIPDFETKFHRLLVTGLIQVIISV